MHDPKSSAKPRSSTSVARGPDPSLHTDRRVQKSKRALVDALVELMIERGFEATSVADIADRANVGRSTFYAHYADKEDLLRESLQGLRGHLETASPSEHDAGVHPALTFALPMLQHVEELSNLFHAVVARRSVARDLVHEMLTDMVKTRLAECPPAAGVDRNLCAEHIVGSFLAVCAWWMNEGEGLTPETLYQAFLRLVAPGL